VPRRHASDHLDLLPQPEDQLQRLAKGVVVLDEHDANRCAHAGSL